MQLSAQSAELASTKSQLEQQVAAATQVRRQLRDLETIVQEQQLAWQVHPVLTCLQACPWAQKSIHLLVHTLVF